jgi:hypothetical protein
MRHALISILAALAGAIGCSGAGPTASDSGARSCPSIAPSCPKNAASEPSYAKDVAPILADSCNGCHSPDGGYGFDLVTYSEVRTQALQGDLVTWISDCSMPPSSYPPLTTAERRTLLDWLACDAPDN